MAISLNSSKNSERRRAVFFSRPLGGEKKNAEQFFSRGPGGGEKQIASKGEAAEQNPLSSE